MSATGLAFYFVFGGNLLLEWGLPGYKTLAPDRGFRNALLMMAIAVLSTLVNGLVFRLVLMPLGMETLVPFVFALLLFSFHGVLSLLSSFLEKNSIPLSGLNGTVLPVSLVLYATAMSTARVVASPTLLVLGGLSATLGYLSASVLLDDIVNRLDLEPVPVSFRGVPIRFMSAGLIALTFSGIDAAFLMNIT